jgi:hypothetical protein
MSHCFHILNHKRGVIVFMPDNFQKWEPEAVDHSFFLEALKKYLVLTANVRRELSLECRPDLEGTALRIHLHSIAFIVSH